jgi:2'-5' RNA ligase
MEEFRFHMTLTGRLDETRREAVLTILRERFARLKLAELAIDRVALFKQADAKARFEIIGDWQLRRA